MKVLVAYMSKTGNTKVVAKAIFEEINDEKEIKTINEVDSIEDYDISFLGFPIHQMGPDKKTAKLLEKHCLNGRNIVLFITHAAPEDSPDLPLMLDKFRQAGCGANMVGMFNCQGELAKSIKMIMSIMPNAQLRPTRPSTHFLEGYYDEVSRQPNSTRKGPCRSHLVRNTKLITYLDPDFGLNNH